MRKYFQIVLCLLAQALLAHMAPAHARDYVPVDQLGHGATLPSPRLSTGKAPRAQSPGKILSRPAGNAPASTRAAAVHASPSKLFGTVGLRRPLTDATKWLNVLDRNAKKNIFEPDRHFTKNMTWDKLRASIMGKSTLDQLRAVNSYWNDKINWPYREDILNWGVDDYWEIPAEFLKMSGDCEDYAIIKYFTLKELGFPTDKMRLVVLSDTVRRVSHAVLTVNVGNEVYVLDNVSNMVRPHSELMHYAPQFSVNESGRWNHVKIKKK